MLGGIIIHGQGVGKVYGYPTANLNLSRSDVSFASGVYAAIAVLNRKKYKAALIINLEPWKVEVHFLDYQGDDLYGEYIEIDPFQKVSEIERYDTDSELKEKISQDVKLVQDLFLEREKI